MAAACSYVSYLCCPPQSLTATAGAKLILSLHLKSCLPVLTCSRCCSQQRPAALQLVASSCVAALRLHKLQQLLNDAC